METNLERLVNLGYPSSWCIRALQATSNDLDLAVEYMLSNATYLEQVVRDAEVLKEQKQVQITETEEDSWMAGVAAELGFVPQEEDSLSAPPLLQLANSPSKEWGFRMFVTPCYSPQVAKKLAQEPETKAKLDTISRLLKTFSPSSDTLLVEFVNQFSSKQGLDPLALSPATLFSNHAKTQRELQSTGLLSRFTLTQLGLRFVVLRNFNRKLFSALPRIDLSSAHSELTKKVSRSRHLLFSQAKMSLLQHHLKDTSLGDSAWMQTNRSPTVILDRSSHGKPLNVFGQLFTQLYRRGIHLSQLRNSDRAFYTIFAGEHSDDFGGPYRDALNVICEELMTFQQGEKHLLTACPNTSSVFVPNPQAATQSALEMFEFIGVLMGIAIRTRTPLPLKMPKFVWKQFLDKSPLVFDQDVEEMDSAIVNRLNQLESVKDKSDWQELDVFYTVSSVDKRTVDLIPNGKHILVPWESKREFLHQARKYRLTECHAQCAAMKRGMATQIPIHFVGSLFTPHELQVAVCGSERIDLDLLKQCTTYGEGVSEKMIADFWATLEKKFSQEEIRKYLKFVWGRATLPASAKEFERKHKINFLNVKSMYHHNDSDEEDENEELNQEYVDQYLPIGHTCFFSIDLPEYSSQEVLEERLLYAISNCLSIDADETTNARQNAAQDRSRVGRMEEEEDLGF